MRKRSGGPWIVKFSGLSGAYNYDNGHNDWRYTAITTQMNSPYYDSRFCALIKAAGRPC